MSMNSPSPIAEAERILRERIYVEHTFPAAEFERALLTLHETRATGTLMIDLSQGGVCSVRFFCEDRKKSNGSNGNGNGSE